MSKSICYAMVLLALSIGSVSIAAESANPYIGHWALTIPGGGAGWLGVVQKDGYLDASILWGGGSVLPVDSVYMDGDTLIVTRVQKVERKDADGKVVRTQTFTEKIVAKASGDSLSLTQIRPRSNGKGVNRSDFTGKRIPPLPPKPDLSKARYGKPVVLFDGTNLDGWKLTNPRQASGWSVEDRVLINRPEQKEGQRHISYGNLRTEAEFEDFNLKLEVNVPEGGNSGVYLRGIYEVQVSNSYGKGLDSHNMGGIYSRITPIVSAEKPVGQWQTMDITLLNRHVTVELNGKMIIDNEPLLGCTGGAMWSDQFRPGPIYLQGDHTAINYRNIVITPVIKSKADQQAVLFEERFDGKPVFKLVKELVDGKLIIIPGRKPMSSETVQLRLIVTSGDFIAQFRPNAEGEFQTATTGTLPAPANDQVSIQCYNGPANAEHWIRFDDFRVSRLLD